MTKAQYQAHKIANKVQKTWEVSKLIAILIGLCYLLVSCVYTGHSVYTYLTSHSFEWRTPFQNPLIIKPLNLKPQLNIPVQKAKPITQYTEKQIVMKSKYGPILWKVYGLESTWGKNDYCRNRGLGYAGFGVLADGQIVCYRSFSDAVARAEYWLLKNWDRKSLAVTLCRWNTGKGSETCPYYESYLSLL